MVTLNYSRNSREKGQVFLTNWLILSLICVAKAEIILTFNYIFHIVHLNCHLKVFWDFYYQHYYC